MLFEINEYQVSGEKYRIICGVCEKLERTVDPIGYIAWKDVIMS